MKLKTLSFLFLIFSAALSFGSCGFVSNPLGEKTTTNLYPIRQNGKNGYINRKGEIVIQPQFVLSMPFSEGLAAVCISPGKCGYIDETGKFVINPQFLMTYRFSDGLAAVIAEDRIGYIDKSGKYIINPQFEIYGAFSTFSEGLAVVKVGDKVGFIDKTGKIIVNPQFENASPFIDALAAVQMSSKWGFVDKEGKIVINPQFDKAQPFVNGLAAVQMGKQYGYIDKTGKILINPQFEEALPFSDEGLAAVFLNGKMGLIDKTGKYVVNPQFGYASFGFDVNTVFLFTSDLGRLSFSEERVPVAIGEGAKKSVGFADNTGKIIINPQFDGALPFYGGLALVNFGQGPGTQFGWIDKEGKIVWREAKETPKAALNTNTAVAINDSSNMSNTSGSNVSGSNMSTSNSSTNERTGRLTTDSNLRSTANKDAASLGIHFKGAKIKILEETSFTTERGDVSNWYKIKVTEYGCSVNTNLGCGKNTPNDADEGWVNAKNVLLD